MLEPGAQTRDLRGAPHRIRAFDDDELALQLLFLDSRQRFAIECEWLLEQHRCLLAMRAECRCGYFRRVPASRCPASAAAALRWIRWRRSRGSPPPGSWLRILPGCGPERCGSSPR